jgi:hypothetical protein
MSLSALFDYEDKGKGPKLVVRADRISFEQTHEIMAKNGFGSVTE